jgi:hypothetical protein
MPGLAHQDEGHRWFEVFSQMCKTKIIPLPMVPLVHNRDCVRLSIQPANISRDAARNKADILDSFLTVNNRWILTPGPGVRARDRAGLPLVSLLQGLQYRDCVVRSEE